MAIQKKDSRSFFGRTKPETFLKHFDQFEAKLSLGRTGLGSGSKAQSGSKARGRRPKLEGPGSN